MADELSPAAKHFIDVYMKKWLAATSFVVITLTSVILIYLYKDMKEDATKSAEDGAEKYIEQQLTKIKEINENATALNKIFTDKSIEASAKVISIDRQIDDFKKNYTKPI